MNEILDLLGFKRQLIFSTAVTNSALMTLQVRLTLILPSRLLTDPSLAGLENLFHFAMHFFGIFKFYLPLNY